MHRKCPIVLAGLWALWSNPAAAAPRAPRLIQAAPVELARFEPRSPWREVFDKIDAFGRLREADGMIPAYKSLEDLRGPKNAEHDAHYASLFGWSDGRGGFEASYAVLVSEEWRLDAQDHWHITQWILRMDLEGNVIHAGHYLLIEDRDGLVLGQRSFDPTPKEIAAQAARLLAQWRSFAPPPPDR